MAHEYQYVNGFYFSLIIPGSEKQGVDGQDTAFQEVSGLSKELEFEEVVSGGENRFKYRLPKTVKSGNLIMKRGVCFNNSPLIKWCKDTLDNGLALPIKPKNVQLMLLNSKRKSCRHWQFTGAYPVKWAASDLNAEKNSIFIETIELTYQFFNLANSGSLDPLVAAKGGTQ